MLAAQPASASSAVRTGHNWRALGPPGVRYVQALAVDPGDGAVVYAGVYGVAGRGLYKTTDGGSSWQRVTDALNVDVMAVALDPENSSTVYVGTSGGEGGVFKSTDRGTTWQPENSGLRWRVKAHTGKWITPTMAITALVIDPAHPATLYAATDPRGVFRSTDAGTSWHPFNAGLTDRNVKTLALDATGRTVYAGTQGTKASSASAAPLGRATPRGEPRAARARLDVVPPSDRRVRPHRRRPLTRSVPQGSLRASMRVLEARKRLQISALR